MLLTNNLITDECCVLSQMTSTAPWCETSLRTTLDAGCLTSWTWRCSTSSQETWTATTTRLSGRSVTLRSHFTWTTDEVSASRSTMRRPSWRRFISAVSSVGTLSPRCSGMNYLYFLRGQLQINQFISKQSEPICWHCKYYFILKIKWCHSGPKPP